MYMYVYIRINIPICIPAARACCERMRSRGGVAVR